MARPQPKTDKAEEHPCPCCNEPTTAPRLCATCSETDDEPAECRGELSEWRRCTRIQPRGWPY